MNKSVKNTYLVHDHAIKSKTKTKQILQKLAFDKDIKSSFPSHRNQARDYFEKQKKRMIQSLKQKMYQNNVKKEIEFMSIDCADDKNTGNRSNRINKPQNMDLNEIEQFMAKLNKLQSVAMNNNNDQIEISIKDFQTMLHSINCLQKASKDRLKIIDVLKEKVNELETNNSNMVYNGYDTVYDSICSF